MKFSYLSYILLVSSLILFMGSCSDDDPEIITLEPEPEIELPNSIAYNTGMTPALPEEFKVTSITILFKSYLQMEQCIKIFPIKIVQ